MNELVAERSARLDHLLAEAIPEVSRTKIVAWIESGHVFVDSVTTKKHGMKVSSGQTIEWDDFDAPKSHELLPEDIALEILFEDEHFLIVNKPRGLVTHPAASYDGPTLVNALLFHSSQLSKAGGDFRPGIVHRLDKETSGLIAIAKTDSAHASLASQFEKKTAERRYFAVVSGQFDTAYFNIEAPIGRNPKNRQQMAISPKGKPALTHCKFIRKFGNDSILAVKLSTGRTHQIRVHLRSIGHPVLGDPIYAPKSLQNYALQLHAAWLSVIHPETNERISVYCSPPDDFVYHESLSQQDIEF